MFMLCASKTLLTIGAIAVTVIAGCGRSEPDPPRPILVVPGASSWFDEIVIQRESEKMNNEVMAILGSLRNTFGCGYAQLIWHCQSTAHRMNHLIVSKTRWEALKSHITSYDTDMEGYPRWMWMFTCEGPALDSSTMQKLNAMARRREALIDTVAAGADERYIIVMQGLYKLMKEMSQRAIERAHNDSERERVREVADTVSFLMRDLARLRVASYARDQRSPSNMAR